jgi:hypothetical protein
MTGCKVLLQVLIIQSETESLPFMPLLLLNALNESNLINARTILLYDQRNVSNMCDLACDSGKFV